MFLEKGMLEKLIKNCHSEIDKEILSELTKTKKDISDFRNYTNQSSLEKDISWLETILEINFKENYFDEDSSKYRIPRVSFEIFKLLLSVSESINENYKEDQLNSYLIEEIREKITQTDRFELKIIYRYLLSRWGFVHDSKEKVYNWKKKNERTVNSLENMSRKLRTAKLNPKTRKKYYNQIVRSIEISSSRLYTSSIDDRARFDDEWIFEFSIEDLLHYISYNLAEQTRASFEKNTKNILDWFHFIIKEEIEQNKKYLTELNKNNLNNFLKYFYRYTPVVMLVKQYEFMNDNSEADRIRKNYYKPPKNGSFDKRMSLQFFNELCEQYGVPKEKVQAFLDVNCTPRDLPKEVCCDYFTFDQMIQFFEENYVVYYPFVKVAETLTFKNKDSRKEDMIYRNHVKKYYTFETLPTTILNKMIEQLKLSVTEIKSIYDSLTVEKEKLLSSEFTEKIALEKIYRVEKVQKLMAEQILLTSEEIIQLYDIQEINKFEQTFDFVDLTQRNRALSNKDVNYFRVDAYLYNLVLDETEAECISSLKKEPVKIVLHSQNSNILNNLFTYIFMKLDNGIELAEMVASM